MLYLAIIGSIFFLSLVLFIDPLRKFFSLGVLSINEWIIVMILSLSPILVVEVFKGIKRKLGVDN